MDARVKPAHDGRRVPPSPPPLPPGLTRGSTARIPSHAAAALLLLLAAAGCGFQPLYGRGADRAGPEELRSVDIHPIADREGQLVHNFLTQRMHPTGKSRRPRYRLEVTLETRRQELGIRKDETATRANLRVTAEMAVRELATGEVVYTSRTVSNNAYNILENRFATISSERDAMHRAARQLADAIHIRLGIFFARRAEGPAPPRGAKPPGGAP